MQGRKTGTEEAARSGWCRLNHALPPVFAVLLRKLKDAAGDADIKVPLKAVRSAIEQSYQQDRSEPRLRHLCPS